MVGTRRSKRVADRKAATKEEEEEEVIEEPEPKPTPSKRAKTGAAVGDQCPDFKLKTDEDKTVELKVALGCPRNCN